MLRKNLIINCTLSFLLGWIMVNAQYGPNDDLDGDGIINSLDIDDDNDGIEDMNEYTCLGEVPIDFTDPTNIPDIMINGQSVSVTATALSGGIIAGGDNLGNISVRADIAGTPVIVRLEFGDSIFPVIRSKTVPGLGWFEDEEIFEITTDTPLRVTDPDDQLDMPTSNDEIVSNSVIISRNSVGPINAYNQSWEVKSLNTTFIEIQYTNPISNNNFTAINISVCNAIKDTDNDGISDYLDLDSDDDGCPDSIEGAADFGWSDLNEDTSLMGDVNTDSASAEYGVPILAGAGQEVGESENADTNTCICFGDPNSDTADVTVVGISTLNRHLNQGDTQWPREVKSALLALDSQEKGFVITRLTQSQIDALSMQAGMLVYNIDEDCLMLCDGASWFCVKQTCLETL